MKPRYRYGILDDFNEVIRWVFDKPAKSVRHIREDMRPREHKIDSAYDISKDLGDALW